VVVVDDSKDAQKHRKEAEEEGLLKLAGGIEYVPTAYDIGIGAGRNTGLAKVTTKYALMLDDDFVATAETDVNRLVAQVSSGEATFAGGELYVEPQDMTMGILADLEGKKKRRVVVSGALSLALDVKRQLLVSKMRPVDTNAKTTCFQAALPPHCTALLTTTPPHGNAPRLRLASRSALTRSLSLLATIRNAQPACPPHNPRLLSLSLSLSSRRI